MSENDFVAVHLSEIPGYDIYAAISSAANPTIPQATGLEALEMIAVRGTALGGLLLDAYAASTCGLMALWKGIASSALGYYPAVLIAFAFHHAQRIPSRSELLA